MRRDAIPETCGSSPLLRSSVMSEDGYKWLSIAVAIVAPVNVFCLLIMVSAAFG